MHGLGEHSERHRNTIDYLIGQGAEVVRFDLRGMGKSEGVRQWIERFDDYLDDVAAVHSWIDRDLKPLPLFLMGHSLGGAICIHYAARNGRALRGLILSAPSYLLGQGVSAIKIAIGKLLARWTPKLRIPESLDLSAISRDPEVVKAYKKDPLNCSFNTVRQGDEILKAIDAIPDACRKITVPTLILHGEADRLILPKGSEVIFKMLAARDKRLEILPGGFHELYNDLDKDAFFTLLRNWMAKVIATPPAT